MKKINLADLIPMDIFIGREPIKIDLVYAQKNHPHNIFNTALYHDKARLWAHKDIAAITLLTARKLNKSHGYILEIQDCLRTTNSQQAMQETEIVKANPQWCEEPDRLLAPPGAGGHPRAMAIDVSLIDAAENIVDMGTPFDTMTEQSHRNYEGFSKTILENRKHLENSFSQSAARLNHPFLPLPSEWWDFRFPPEFTKQIEPLSEADLPPQMQMTDKIDNNIPDFPQEHFDKLAQEIINIVNENI